MTQNSNTCLQGAPKRNGVNGHNGLPGRDGQDGAKGEKGVTGPPGEKGERGSSRTDTDHWDWKQCAWRSSDSRDIGLIKVC